MGTRGWMGGASRRGILSIKPEILFLRAVLETSLNVPRSFARKCVKGYTTVEGCQVAHSSFSAYSDGFGVVLEPAGQFVQAHAVRGDVKGELHEVRVGDPSQPIVMPS